MNDTTKTANRFGKGLTSFVTYRIARVQNRLNAQAAAILRKHTNLSLTEWRILSIVNLIGPTTASAISREVNMDKGQISRAVKPLASAGLLASVEHEHDHRQTILQLTPRGKSIVDANVQIMRERQAQLTHDIDDAELEAFYRVLDKLQNNIEMPEK